MNPNRKHRGKGQQRFNHLFDWVCASSLDILSKDINTPYFSLSLSSPRVYFLTFLPLTIKTVFNWTTTLSHFVLLCTYFNLIDANVTAVVKARLNSSKSRVSECRWRMLVMREQKWGSALIRCLHWNVCVCVFFYFFIFQHSKLNSQGLEGRRKAWESIAELLKH